MAVDPTEQVKARRETENDEQGITNRSRQTYGVIIKGNWIHVGNLNLRGVLEEVESLEHVCEGHPSEISEHKHNSYFIKENFCVY